MADETVNYREAERFFQDQRDTQLREHLEDEDEGFTTDESYENPCGLCHVTGCPGYGTGNCPPEGD